MPTDAPPSLIHDGAVTARILAVIGGFMIIALACLVTISILLRWLGQGSVDGDFELVQMGLALSVFAFLPLCQARRGNVMVDTFTSHLPRKGQMALDVFWDLVFASFAFFMAWRLGIGAMEAFASRTTTM